MAPGGGRRGGGRSSGVSSRSSASRGAVSGGRRAGEPRSAPIRSNTRADRRPAPTRSRPASRPSPSPTPSAPTRRGPNPSALSRRQTPARPAIGRNERAAGTGVSPAGRIRNPQPPTRTTDLRGVGGKKVSLEVKAARAYRELRAAARAAGFKAPLFDVVSGLRSDARQRQLFNAAVKKYGSVAEARKWVAPPGKSAHRSGRVVDLHLGPRNQSSTAKDIRATAAWKWMRDNAGRFGFNPYPREPWHWEHNVK